MLLFIWKQRCGSNSVHDFHGAPVSPTFIHVERPKNKKQFTPDQQGVKRYLNKNYRRELFNSIRSPITVTERYLDEFREALAKPNVFDTIRYKKFREIGHINQKRFLTCLEAIENERRLRSTILDKVVDHVIDRPSLKFEMLAAEVAHDHLVNVEWALNEMQEKPLNRDLSWLYDPDDKDETLQLRWREVDELSIEEFEGLKYRYFMPSVSPGVNAEELIRNELSIFSKLLAPGHYEDKWHDLHDYPEDALQGKVDLRELYIAAQDLRKGKLVDAIDSPYYGRRKLMAKVMGIVLYMEYLKGELPEKPTLPQQPQVVQNIHNDYRTIIEGLHLTKVDAVLVKNELHQTEQNLTFKSEIDTNTLQTEDSQDLDRQSPDLKFLLDMDMNTREEWKRRLVEMYNRLTGEIGDGPPLIKARMETFLAVFLEGLPLCGRIIWLQENKPLGYFLHVLCGADFKDKVIDSRPDRIIASSNTSVFIKEVNVRKKYIERVENCFANQDGTKRTGKSTLESRSRTYLKKDIKQRLLDIATTFVNG